MKFTLKCFATLSQHLPKHAKANAAEVELESSMSVNQIIDHYKINREDAYLVILNGIFICPPDRDATKVKEGDVLALWPPVAGG